MIALAGAGVNAVVLPPQPPMLEHMMLQLGALLQWFAEKLWPSSWHVRATRLLKLDEKFVCESP